MDLKQKGKSSSWMLRRNVKANKPIRINLQWNKEKRLLHIAKIVKMD